MLNGSLNKIFPSFLLYTKLGNEHSKQLIQISLCSSTILNYLADRIEPNFLHWNAHIFLFGLILRDIPNSITPQTTFCLLPIPVRLLTPVYPPVQAVPHYSLPLFFFLSQTDLCLWQACATTACSECAR